MKYDEDWLEKYKDMIETPRKALTNIKSGHRVFLGTGCGEPTELVENMTRMARSLADVPEIYPIISSCWEETRYPWVPSGKTLGLIASG